MDVKFPNCAGMDVHKDTIWVCSVKSKERGEVEREIRQFGTTTRELLEMRAWLESAGITHAVVESTGVYWKPVFNILDGDIELWLANAADVKGMPGRKTDAKDCEWLADLMRHGLIKRSFVPERAQHELRELTRYRIQVTRDRAREVNRIHKLLEGANVKLGSVLSQIDGVSGIRILRAMTEGISDPEALALLAEKSVIKKKERELVESLTGSVGAHQRFMLRVLLQRLADAGATIKALDVEIAERLRPFDELIERLSEIPGVAIKTAQVILAEIGTDMSRFPEPENLASWAGLCPGNHESAGKRSSGKTRQGSKWLKTTLVQVGWAASRTKNSHLKARYLRMKSRRGAKRAVVAQAHLIIRIVHLMIEKGVSYRELGPDHLAQRDQDREAKRLTNRLGKLGYDVTLQRKAG